MFKRPLLSCFILILALLALAACALPPPPAAGPARAGGETLPAQVEAAGRPEQPAAAEETAQPTPAPATPIDSQLRAVVQSFGITALDPGPEPEPAKVALGQALFFDKAISGNRDIACATCHHPTLAGGDELSLSVGTGAMGLGPSRLRGAMRPLIPRNAPEIFNRGAPEWRTMFWDSRVSGDPVSGFNPPASSQVPLPAGLDSVLAAQAMFPVTSAAEMRGARGDMDVEGHSNDLALLSEQDLTSVWETLTQRLLAMPGYEELFAAAYPDTPPDQFGFQDAANAIAAFEIDGFTLLDSPWDRYLAGDDAALSPAEKRGALLFYGRARCAGCHSGNLFTDQEHHNIGVPQVGPGKGREAPYVDFGRFRETGDPADRFAFRTPPLRNVAITGPWMHNGAYTTLEAAVQHHFDAVQALRDYDLGQLSPDLQSDTRWQAQIVSEILSTLDPALNSGISLSEDEFADLMAFLDALTDPAATDLGHLVPATVPSGLPVLDGPTGPTAFECVTLPAGITALHQPAYQITGQAWGDVDNDGWLDLYLTTGQGANSLYHNNGDGSFSLSPLSSQVALAEHDSGGALFADYDNDGWADLFVTGKGANALFHNDGGEGFSDVTAQAGVGETGTGKSAAWGDYDNDGWLDLYVANWSCIPNCPHPYEGDADHLYHNNGDGTFSDASRLVRPSRHGAGFVAAWSDFDGDGDLDLYVVNDEFAVPTGNYLWRNDGPGCGGWCFQEVGGEMAADARVMGMGLAVDDFDGDGLFDFFFTNAGPNRLLRGQINAVFAEAAGPAGVAVDRGTVSWGAVPLDYDNDGWRDLYVAVMRRSAVSAFNILYHNNGDGTFSDTGHAAGADDPGPSMGVAYADYDRDGWVDLVVGNYNRGYQLFRNAALDAGDHHWLTLKLVGGGPVNRDAVGARVRVLSSDGRSQVQEVRSGFGLGGGSALELYFGLGAAQIERVEIRWPDGTEETLPALAANQAYEVSYGGEASAR